MRFLIPLLLMVLPGCASSEYRFERIEGDQRIQLPLKFESLSGVRDGYSVNATARFSDGQDSAEVSMAVFLRPPAEFTSGTYTANIAGRSSAGIVDCDSLTFLGGQASAPSIGGVFVLRDPEGRPAYRVTMPATLLQSRTRPAPL